MLSIYLQGLNKLNPQENLTLLHANKKSDDPLLFPSCIYELATFMISTF